jgi:hypothetical protein
MNCHDFENRLNGILDDRGDPAADSRLIAHAGRCRSCEQLLAGQRALLTGLRQLTVPSTGRDFSRRIVAEVASAPVYSVQPGRIWLAIGAVLASAAAVLLAVSLVWYARGRAPGIADNRQPPSAPRSTAPRRPPARGLTTIDQPILKKQRSIADDRRSSDLPSGPPSRAPKAVAPSGSDWLIEAPRLPEHLRGSLDNLAVTIPETVERLDQMQQRAPGMRPIRMSLTRIWETFASALPSAREQASPPRDRTSSRWIDAVLTA